MDDLEKPKKRNLCWAHGCQNKFKAKYMLGLQFEGSIGRIENRVCRIHFEEAWNELQKYVKIFLNSVHRESEERSWGPGWRYFRCGDCGYQWSEKSCDCFSLSGETCRNCQQFVSPMGGEMHLEWPVDPAKNLISEAGGIDAVYEEIESKNKEVHSLLNKFS